jgi:hypothetical protein
MRRESRLRRPCRANSEHDVLLPCVQRGWVISDSLGDNGTTTDLGCTSGDPSRAVAAYAAAECNDTGMCEQWAGVVDSPLGGSFTTVGGRIDCSAAAGEACGQYAAIPQYNYPDGHTAPLELLPPEGYVLDDSFASDGIGKCAPTESCNVGDAAWLTGQSPLGNNGAPLELFCSDYPIAPTPENVAESLNAYAQLFLVNPSDPHHAWVYFVRTGGFTPACNTTTTSTSTTATYKWGQLWTANITASLFHHGSLVKRSRLGTLGYRHHHWAFTHHRGRYMVRVCGTHARRSAPDVRACIQRRCRFS